LHVTALILAAGQGRRFGGDIQKQFILLDDKPIVYYTLKRFESSSVISNIILIVPESWLSSIPELLVEKYQFKKISKIIAGGKERYHSVVNGLDAVPPNTDIVVVHDGVRPFISTELIEKAVCECQSADAVALAVPIKDTVKIVENNYITHTLDRSLLKAIQTPQVFKYELLVKAYQDVSTNEAVTDDATLVERLGHPVKVITGDYFNIKITSPEDLIWAHQILRTQHF